MMPPEIVGEQMEPERFYDSVNVLLSLQVRINLANVVSSRILIVHL